MCSRYSLTSPHEAVRAYFKYGNDEPFPPRYNIAPTQPAAIVRPGLNGQRELALVRWGLLPSWVKNPREFSTLLNARSETAVEKPAFRAAMRQKRCLVPADGYYEWTGPVGDKRPHLIRLKAGGPMGLAGIWEHWLGSDGSEVETMAILTTSANRALAHIHDRMPVVLAPETFDTWLDCKGVSAKDAALLLQPAPDKWLEAITVSKAVNNPRNEGPDLHRPLTAGTA
jgi:putative SOS response-associated peptidase YedK